MSNGTKEYDYRNEGRNIYNRSAKVKPVLKDEAQHFKEATALWNKKEEILEKERLEKNAKEMFIAEQVIGSISSAKKIASKQNTLKFDQELKPLIIGQHKLTYDDYSTTEGIFKKKEGFLRGGAGGNMLNPKLEFTSSFLDYLDDIGNMSLFMSSEQGQDILNRIANNPRDYDRLPGFDRKQWKDIQKHGGDAANWEEYIRTQSIDNPIWENSAVFDLLNKDMSYSPANNPDVDIDNVDLDSYDADDVVYSEVNDMLQTWDYMWQDDLFDSGGDV